MKDLFLTLIASGIAWLIWRAFANKPKAGAQPTELPKNDDAQKRHLRNTLEFAKSHYDILANKHREQKAWQQAFGNAKADELDSLSGPEFEDFLAGLYRAQGYGVELTPLTGDYGADLILIKDRRRIAVQAKRYAGSVGVSAVQEALSGQAYYRCDTAWVVTTGIFTANARELAHKSSVKLIGRSDIGNLMAQHSSKTANG